MKKMVLSGLAIMFGFAVVAQQAQLKSGIPTRKHLTGKQIAVEPARGFSNPPTVTSKGNGDSPSIVTCLELGTSANAYGNGYGGGQKTIVWADDDLKAVINIHRMGPGSTPPSFSGYIGVDWATNMGKTAGDWTNNWQVYAATLNTGGSYFLDAGRYPQGGIYNPAGNTDINNAYIHYFAPNLSNSASQWGGYSYGVVPFANQADSTKHLYWYQAPAYTYIPDGFTIMPNGNSLATDIDQNWESGSVEYMGNLLVHRGVWNDVTKDYDYTMNTMVPLPTTENQRPDQTRVASSPSGNDVWMVTLGNNHGTVQVDTTYYYPILFHSTDGGQTWSDPIAVQLDGPNGIDAIVNGLLSDYLIEQVFLPPFPSREEISYTTAFDCDIVVDKWGNPHIGVVIGLGGSDPYSIATGDSLFAVYDIYSPDKGTTWCGVKMGTPVTFRGTFGDLTEDNRVNISVNKAGDKVVVTWIDTKVEGVTDNINPDVFARGFDLINNKITVNGDGEAQPDNVTFLSDMMTQAYFATASHYMFTENDNVVVPIVTELLSDPNDPAAPVTFYYIPDFAYTPAQFSVTSGGCAFPTGVNNMSANTFSISITPNPVKDIAHVQADLTKGGNAVINVVSTTGQTVLSLNKVLNTGNNTMDINVNGLTPGMYFVTVNVNNEQITKKMIVR